MGIKSPRVSITNEFAYLCKDLMRTCINSSTFSRWVIVIVIVREGAKKNRLFSGHVPYQGGLDSTPLPLKIVDFFQTQSKNYSACPQ